MNSKHQTLIILVQLELFVTSKTIYGTAKNNVFVMPAGDLLACVDVFHGWVLKFLETERPDVHYNLCDSPGKDANAGSYRMTLDVPLY